MLQQRALKRKNFDQILSSSPSLLKLESMLNLTLWWGFLLITGALVSGAFFTQMFASQQEGIILKSIWALAVWIWYLATLVGRHVQRRPARQTAIMCFFGFLLLLTTFFGIFLFNPLGSTTVG